MFGVKMESKLNIVFDFDGVICDHITGNWSHEKFGEPLKEGIDLVKELYRSGHELKLSTTRLCPMINGKHDNDVITGRAKVLLKNKLNDLGIIHCFTEITGYKCYGDVYIDDRAINFKHHSIDEIKDLLKTALHNRQMKLNSF